MTTQEEVHTFICGEGLVADGKDVANLLQALPWSLQDDILEHLITASVRPGKVFFGRFMDPAIRAGILQIPNRELYQRVTTKLFSNNTWVIPPGEEHTMAFLEKLSSQSLSKIRSVELAFSWTDSFDFSPGDELVYINNKAKERRLDGQSVDKRMLKQQYDAELQACGYESLRIWYNKFGSIANLNLHHVKLDFMRAYNASDDFIGDILVTVLPAFKYGLPAHLEIVASTPYWKRSIMEILTWKNATGPEPKLACSFCVEGLH